MKGNTHRSTSSASSKKHSIANSHSTSAKSIKEPELLEPAKNIPEGKAPAKLFKMEEEFDFYESDYE